MVYTLGMSSSPFKKQYNPDTCQRWELAIWKEREFEHYSHWLRRQRPGIGRISMHTTVWEDLGESVPEGWREISKLAHDLVNERLGEPVPLHRTKNTRHVSFA
jgi:hypothetical protein